MPNIKKEAADKIIKRLQGDIINIKHEIRRNKNLLDITTKKQTELKRQLPIIQELIRSIDANYFTKKERHN